MLYLYFKRAFFKNTVLSSVYVIIVFLIAMGTTYFSSAYIDQLIFMSKTNYQSIEVHHFSETDRNNSYVFYNQELRFYKNFNPNSQSYSMPISNISIQKMDVLYDKYNPYITTSSSNENNAVWISNHLANIHGLNVGDKIYIKIEETSIEVTIVGKIQSTYGIFDIQPLNGDGVIILSENIPLNASSREIITFLPNEIRNHSGSIYPRNNEITQLTINTSMLLGVGITIVFTLTLTLLPILLKKQDNDFVYMHNWGMKKSQIKALKLVIRIITIVIPYVMVSIIGIYILQFEYGLMVFMIVTTIIVLPILANVFLTKENAR